MFLKESPPKINIIGKDVIELIPRVLRVALDVSNRQFPHCNNNTPYAPDSMDECHIGFASLQGLNRFESILAVGNQEKFARLILE